MQYGGHAEEALEALASHASSVRYRSPVEDSESHLRFWMENSEKDAVKTTRTEQGKTELNSTGLR